MDLGGEEGGTREEEGEFIRLAKVPGAMCAHSGQRAQAEGGVWRRLGWAGLSCAQVHGAMGFS